MSSQDSEQLETEDFITILDESDCTGQQLFKQGVSYENIGIYGARLQQGSVKFGENCKAEISALLFGIEREGRMPINVENGITLSRERGSDKFIFMNSGEEQGIVEINGQKFFLGEGDKLVLGKEAVILQAKFSCQEGGNYDFPNQLGFSTPNSGKVDFNSKDSEQAKPAFITLPQGATINNLDSGMKTGLGEELGLIVRGQNIKLSDELTRNIYGNPSERFREFSGELGFANSENRYEELSGSRHFAFMKPSSKVSFPNAGVNIESAGGAAQTLIVFGKQAHRPSSEDGGASYFIEDVDYRLGMTYRPDGIISLEENKIEIEKIKGILKQSQTRFTFDENSHYAGFDVQQHEYFEFSIENGHAILHDKRITFTDNNPSFSVANGIDTFNWESYSGSLILGESIARGNSINDFEIEIPGQKFYGKKRDSRYSTFSFGDSSVFEPRSGKRPLITVSGEGGKPISPEELSLIQNLGTEELKYTVDTFMLLDDLFRNRMRQIKR